MPGFPISIRVFALTHSRRVVQRWLRLISVSLGDMEPLYKPNEVAARLREKYAAIVEDTPRGLQLRFPGVAESFELSTADDELTVFAESWHEHFEDIETLERFLDGLFSGSLEIVVTYRGSTPVAHKVVALRDGEMQVMSSTVVLVPLFWRRKSQRTLNYKSPNQSLQPTASRSDV